MDKEVKQMIYDLFKVVHDKNIDEQTKRALIEDLADFMLQLSEFDEDPEITKSIIAEYRNSRGM